jgi:cytochrome c556
MTPPNNSVSRKRPKHLKIRALGAVTIAMALLVGSTAAVAAAAQPEPQNIQQIMQQQIKLMKPELQKKVKALSPVTKKSLMKILAQHSRYSETATLRQVMTEVLTDYQSMVAGIMTENSEQAADSALRLANHRIPVGGLLPYLGMENISDERLAILSSFNDSVEGNAKKLAAAAESGDMALAASFLGPISTGCVACHAVFRSQPGRSNLLR